MVKIFFTGDGNCPVCGMMMHGDKPETHHTHDIASNMAYRSMTPEQKKTGTFKVR